MITTEQVKQDNIIRLKDLFKRVIKEHPEQEPGILEYQEILLENIQVLESLKVISLKQIKVPDTDIAWLWVFKKANDGDLISQDYDLVEEFLGDDDVSLEYRVIAHGTLEVTVTC